MIKLFKKELKKKRIEKKTPEIHINKSSAHTPRDHLYLIISKLTFIRLFFFFKLKIAKKIIDFFISFY